ncbi:MAG: hypothetical protein CVT48_05630 [Thermoplasmata archaeon HGW-Thermoplasmata-1]|nr:MAG: hypothetical protein CVT48_05630 [Thermoplasmata archaeon HGW-Thermoplasmata-1]
MPSCSRKIRFRILLLATVLLFASGLAMIGMVGVEELQSNSEIGLTRTKRGLVRVEEFAAQIPREGQSTEGRLA